MISRNGRGICRRVALVCFAFACAGITTAYAQYPEDALRLGMSGIGIGARALGMGGAYTGVASDYSALYWNPAGLAQATYGEFSAGLSYQSNDDKGTFYSQQTPFTSNTTNLNALGLVYPVPVRRGSLVLAFGFSRQAAFTSGLSFTGFNPNSSIIQVLAPNGTAAPTDLSGDIAYQLYLANVDSATGRYVSPITNRLTQSGTVTETGGLNNWSVGGAVDVARNLSLGITLTYVAGSYHYERQYNEADNLGIYPVPFDLAQLSLQDLIDDDISGVNAKFGLMYRVPDKFRLGIAVKTPTAFNIKETYSTTGSASFRTPDAYGQTNYGPVSNPGSIEYDVHTPWVLSAGASFILRDLVLSGDVDYTDWTSLEFANTNQDLLNENLTIKQTFRAAADWRLGAEYTFQQIGLRLRGGYMHFTSPYQGDPSSFDKQYVTGGLGIMLGDSSMLDLAYAMGWWKTYRLNYQYAAGDMSARVDEKLNTNNFLLTFTHRF